MMQLEEEALKRRKAKADAEEILAQLVLERKKMELQAELESAAIMVQAAWKGVMARKEFTRIRKEYDAKIATEKARMIQFGWRRHCGRSKLAKLEQWYNEKIRTEAAVVVQQHVRGTMARMLYSRKKDKKSKILMIQCSWRRSIARHRASRLREEKLNALRLQKAIMISCSWRQKLARKHVQRLREEKRALLEEESAIVLQSAWRRKLAYKKFHRLRKKRLKEEGGEAGGGEAPGGGETKGRRKKADKIAAENRRKKEERIKEARKDLPWVVEDPLNPGKKKKGDKG